MKSKRIDGWLVFSVLIGLWLSGCGTVWSNAWPNQHISMPRFNGKVRLSVTKVPGDAKQLGIVEVHCPDSGTIEDIIPVFAERVAEMGGDYGKIDKITAIPKMFGTTIHNKTVKWERFTTSLWGRVYRTAGD